VIWACPMGNISNIDFLNGEDDDRIFEKIF
jgi:hypothetical protein